MKKLNSEGKNEYETKTWALKLAVHVLSFTACQQFKKNNNSKNSKAAAVSKVL